MKYVWCMESGRIQNFSFTKHQSLLSEYNAQWFCLTQILTFVDFGNLIPLQTSVCRQKAMYPYSTLISAWAARPLDGVLFIISQIVFFFWPFLEATGLCIRPTEYCSHLWVFYWIKIRSLALMGPSGNMEYKLEFGLLVGPSKIWFGPESMLVQI